MFIGVIFENKKQGRTDGKEKIAEKNGENRVHYHRLFIHFRNVVKTKNWPLRGRFGRVRPIRNL